MSYQEYRNLSDEELVSRYAFKQEQAAFNVLFERYYHIVYGVCVKHLKNAENAKDTTQQIFEKLLADLPRFQIQHFKSWLYTVAKSQCLMVLRKTQPNIAPSANGQMEFMENNDNLHLVVEKEVMLNRLEDAIQLLNAEQKSCIELFYLQKKSYQEIADITGYTLLQVKSNIQNGKRNLKIRLSGNE